MFKHALRRFFLIILFVCSLILSFGWGHISLPNLTLFNPLVIAQTTNTREWVNTGIEDYNQGNYKEAIINWQKALNLALNPQEKQIILENIARAYQKLEQNDQALAIWEKVEKYENNLDSNPKLGRILTEKAQIYLNIGQTQTAIALLCNSNDDNACKRKTALEIARKNEDIQGESAALGTLGEAYRLMGKYDQSIQTLEMAFVLSPSIYQAALQQSLGNTYTARGQLWQIRSQSAEKTDNIRSNGFKTNAISDYQQADSNFRLSLQLSNDPAIKLENLLSLIRLSYYSQDFNLISLQQRENDLQQALTLLNTVPPTPTLVYASLDLATLPSFNLPLIAPLAHCPSQWQLSEKQRLDILNNALNMAKNLNNSRLESFVLGALGHFDECRGEVKNALKLTQQAILVASQDLNAKDSLYLWEWQKGRIFEAKKQLNLAVNAYQDAYNTLENIRSDLLTAEKDVQFDFRDSIEPIYRKLAQLKLQLVDSQNLPQIQQKEQLKEVLKIIDHLRLAELQNYLGNDCFWRIEQPNSQPISSFPQTAIINSLIFEDKTAIILSLPDDSIKIHWINQSKENINQNILRFRQNLIDGFVSLGNYDTSLSENLYNEIIGPFEKDLEENKIKTLVFIQDGLFRILPMAALHDGRQFLIETYTVATTPSLSLTDLQKPTLAHNKALILGVTGESNINGQIFPALANIPLEIATVSQQFPNRQPLINEQFTPQTLTQTLDNANYPIIHIATHAQFGIIPDDTFLVTGNNDKMTIINLENSLNLLKSGSKSVELLTLTACETAEGDERSALGLAGVAIQAGVKSAIASLWPVSDESTLSLIAAFYDHLIESGVSKAEALRQAQIKLIKAKENPDINDQYSNPVYWSSFILIGNWL